MKVGWAANSFAIKRAKIILMIIIFKDHDPLKKCALRNTHA